MTRWVNGAWSDYDSFKDSSVVIPGAGFMMVTENQGKSMTLSKPKLIRPDKMLYSGIALNQGWNLVGNPFLVNVPFDCMIFQGGSLLSHYYFSGTGTQGGWEGSGSDVDTLRSWQGWAVQVDSACTLKFDLSGCSRSNAACCRVEQGEGESDRESGQSSTIKRVGARHSMPSEMTSGCPASEQRSV